MRSFQPFHIIAVLNAYPTLSETFLYTTLTNLINSGMKVTVYARRKGDGPHHIPGLAVRYLPSEDWVLPLRLLVLVVLFVRYSLQSFGDASRLLYDLILQRSDGSSFRYRVHLMYRLLPLLLAGADMTYFSHGGLAVNYFEYLRRKPAIFSLRGSDINIEPLNNDSYRKRLKETIFAARAVHCVCKDILRKAESLSGTSLSKARVIYTAVNPSFKDLIPHSQTGNDRVTRIVTVGRLNWRKGLEHGMMAIHHLKAKGIPVKWIIVGAGEYEIPLRWAIRDMGLSETVVHTGGKNQAEVKTILSQSDIFFHPSVHEGISNAVLEAMAVGLPVVTTTVGGMQEALVDGRHVLFVKPRDWMEMANKLEQLIDNPDLRRELGQCGCSHVLDFFSVEKQQREFLSLFQSALKGDPG